MISEVQHKELNINEDSNETMNEDKKGSRLKVKFLDSKSVEKICNALSMLKIKNVK